MTQAGHHLRFGYADTRHGQLHYRRAPGHSIDIVLLHWAPATGRMYDAIIPALANLGLGAFAPDLPGFGASLKPAAPWGPAEMAACLLDALDSLGAAPVVVVGGHLAANVAIEMALRDPVIVPAVCLDGVYAVTEAEGAALAAPYAGLTPRIRPDGAHRHFVWDMTVAFLHEWNPRFEASPQTLPQMYAAMGDYLQMGYAAMLGWLEPEAPPPAYDALARIAALETRLLVLTAEQEALRPAFPRALSANPRARGHEFPGNHPLFDAARAAEYAAVIAAFARGG